MRIPIVQPGSPEPIPGTLLLALESLAGPLLVPPRLAWWALLAVCLTGLCWVPFLRGVTRSVTRIEQGTTRIAEGQFDTDLAVARQDELGRLAGAIEGMAGRLDHLVTGQKRFLSDAAHELRSPLARMRLAQELLAQRVGETERPYVADLEEDLDAMSGLTDQLLALARSEGGPGAARLDPLDLSEGIARAVDSERRAGVTIDVDVPAGVMVYADAELFVRAVANVLRNAVRYAGDAGPVEVRAVSTMNAVDVVVTDSGPGVPPHCPRASVRTVLPIGTVAGSSTWRHRAGARDRPARRRAVWRPVAFQKPRSRRLRGHPQLARACVARFPFLHAFADRFRAPRHFCRIDGTAVPDRIANRSVFMGVGASCPRSR